VAKLGIVRFPTMMFIENLSIAALSFSIEVLFTPHSLQARSQTTHLFFKQEISDSLDYFSLSKTVMSFGTLGYTPQQPGFYKLT